MNNKPPMSLENLPGYMDSLRKSGSTDDSLVVDMGRIVEPPKSSINWFRPAAFALAFCLFLIVGVSYNAFSDKNITIVLDTNNIEAISDIVSANGGNVVNIKQNGDSSYEVKIDKLQNVKSFIESLRKNKDVKKVEKIGF
jgi:hypothetical protein